MSQQMSLETYYTDLLALLSTNGKSLIDNTDFIDWIVSDWTAPEDDPDAETPDPSGDYRIIGTFVTPDGSTTPPTLETEDEMRRAMEYLWDYRLSLGLEHTSSLVADGEDPILGYRYSEFQDCSPTTQILGAIYLTFYYNFVGDMRYKEREDMFTRLDTFVES